MQREEPVYQVQEFFPRRTRYAFAVVLLNEGERIRAQLGRMRARAELADIVLADGGSTDGSLTGELLRECGVRALLTTPERGLSTATRVALAYALDQGYEGVVTVDGNGKDGVEALPDFLRALDEGFDLVQGSRYLPGGFHCHTPLERQLAIRFLMRPCIAAGSGFWYTDPTNAFRGLSRRFLVDPRVEPLRRIFVRFSLQLYFVCQAPRLGFRVREIPVRRVYPSDGSVPTKIAGWRTKARIMGEAILVACGWYNPRR